MKKTLAIFLSTVLLLSASFVAIPVSVSADTEPATPPIEATPLSGAIATGSLGVTATNIYSLTFTKTSGSRVVLNSGRDFVGVNSEGRGISGFRFDMAAGTKIYQGDTHFMFRYEANNKSTFTPMIVLGTWYYLKSGATVKVLRDGAAGWETISTTNTLKPQIKLDESFSGYIKIAYNDFDNNGISTSDDRIIPRIDIYTYGMGTVGENTYASDIIVGPFFTVSSDSESTTIKVPEDYKPDPIEAKPLLINNINTNSIPVSATDSWPFSNTSATGKQITLNAGRDFYELNSDQSGRGAKGVTFTMDNSQASVGSNDTCFMLRYETDNASNITLVFKHNWSALRKNVSFQVLEDGATIWKSVKTVNGKLLEDSYAQIEFDKSFRGYIKIPYSDFNTPIQGTSLTKIDLYITGMGTVGENTNASEMMIGPFFTITSDSSSGEIEVSEDYAPNLTNQVRPLLNTDDSAPGINTAYVNEFLREDRDNPRVTPISEMGFEGRKLELKVPFDNGEDLGNTWPKLRLPVDDNTKLTASDTHIMFYLETNGTLAFIPSFSIGDHFLYLRRNCTVQVLRDGCDIWENLKSSRLGGDFENGTDYGGYGLKFDGEFKGFIRISYSDIGLRVVGSIAEKIASLGECGLSQMGVQFQAMGVVNNNIYASEVTIGPIFSVTSISAYASIDVESEKGDVYVDGLLNSKDLIVIRKYLLTGIDSKYLTKFGDYNNDNVVDIIDLVLITEAIGDSDFDAEFTLPEMVPFMDHTDLSPAAPFYKMIVSEIDSPIPKLSNSKGISISNELPVDMSSEECLTSGYAAYQDYNDMTLGDITHIMIYLKVPETKDNQLTMSIRTRDAVGQFGIARNSPYALLPIDSDKWEHYNTSNSPRSLNGTFTLPAGFEGFLKIPLSTLHPNRATENTKIYQIAYRFSHIETNNNIIVGPLFGITSDNDPGPSEDVLTDLPTATTHLNVNTIADGDIFTDKVMISWQQPEGAKEYRIDAYLVHNEDNGTTYRRVNQVRAFTNSGTVTDLEPNTCYAFVINALDNNNEKFASSDAIFVTTSTENMYAHLTTSEVLQLAPAEALDPEVERTYTTLYSNYESLTNQNPNRGFRGYAHFTDFTITTEQLRTQFANWMLRHRDNLSSQVAVVYFYLPQYKGKNLDNKFFGLVQTAFDYARENKIQLIVRFAYYTYSISDNNCNINNSPTTEEMMLHINQIADNGIIERNKDVIHSFQVGFVGFGGEWHSETAGRNTNHNTIINAIVNRLVPADIYIQARKPEFKALVNTNPDRLSMIGFNHDSFTGIEDCRYLGGGNFTIGTSDWDTWVNTGAYAPQDAECQYYKDSMLSYREVSEAYACLLGMSQVRMTTFSSENGYLEHDALVAGDASTMGTWKKMPVTEKWLRDNGIPYSENWFKNLDNETVERNVFEFIRDYLGYRFTVTSLSSNKSGENLDVTFNIENHGFSAGFNMESNLVILDADNNPIETVEAGNPKNWHCTDPDNYSDRTQLVHTVNASIKLPTENGEYKLALQLISHNGATARLDNNIEYENGFNILHTFHISNPS